MGKRTSHHCHDGRERCPVRARAHARTHTHTQSALRGSVSVYVQYHGTHTTNNATCCQPSVPITVKLVLTHANTRYVILVVVQTTCFTPVAASPSDRKCNTMNGAGECKLPTHLMTRANEYAIIAAVERKP